MIYCEVKKEGKKTVYQVLLLCKNEGNVNHVNVSYVQEIKLNQKENKQILKWKAN